MIGVRMWVRSTWKYLMPAMLLVQCMVLMDTQGMEGAPTPYWRVDWSWMLSVWDGGTLLLCPLACAVVVWLEQRAWRHPADELVAVVPRGVRSRLDIVCAVLVQGLGVQLVTLAVAAALCWGTADASGLTMPWQLFTGPCALVAACFLGGLIGEFWKDPWAVPVTAVGVFFAQRPFFWMGYPEVLTTEMATGPVPGMRPIPAHLIATAEANLAFAVLCVAPMLWHVRMRGTRRHWLWCFVPVAVAALVAIFYPFVASHALNTYEPQ